MGYKIIADLHTHTIFSLHAFSTIGENIEAARRRGLLYLACTDHFYGHEDDILSKNEYNRIEHLEDTVHPSDIRVIGGVEMNLGQRPSKIPNVSWRPLGIHCWFIDRERITLPEVESLLKEELVSLKYGTSIAHIEREIHRMNHGKYGDVLCPQVKQFLDNMVGFCQENSIPMELNETSIRVNEGGGAERVEFWLSRAKEYGSIIYLGSDAHYKDDIGVFPEALKLLEKLKYPEDKILNCNPELLGKYFN